TAAGREPASSRSCSSSSRPDGRVPSTLAEQQLQRAEVRCSESLVVPRRRALHARSQRDLRFPTQGRAAKAVVGGSACHANRPIELAVDLLRRPFIPSKNLITQFEHCVMCRAADVECAESVECRARKSEASDRI